MANNIRDEIIDRLWEAFRCITEDPSDSTMALGNDKPLDTDKPLTFKSLLANFTLPTDLDDPDLPAVSFGYGGSRLVGGAFTQEEENIFSVYVYPIVPILENVRKVDDMGNSIRDGIQLLESASAMEETVRRIVYDLNAYQIAYDDDIVIGVSVGQVLAGEGKFTEYEFMEFRLDFRVAYQIPLETEL